MRDILILASGIALWMAYRGYRKYKAEKERQANNDMKAHIACGAYYNHVWEDDHESF